MKSKIFSEILSEVTPEIESKVERKIIEIMESTKENIFLNLSKLSEEQQRKVIALLPEEKIEYDYAINEVCYFLIYEEDEVKWSVLHNFWIKGKQELTYTQFIEMMGGESNEVLQGENNGWIKIESEKDLPPYNKWVIAYTKDGANHIAYFDKRKNEWVANSKFGDEITHWRHEPEPPKF